MPAKAFDVLPGPARPRALTANPRELSGLHWPSIQDLGNLRVLGAVVEAGVCYPGRVLKSSSSRQTGHAAAVGAQALRWPPPRAEHPHRDWFPDNGAGITSTLEGLQA
jgi:hypothetical protein